MSSNPQKRKRGRPRGSKNKFGPKGPLGRQILTEGEIRQFNLGTLPVGIKRQKKRLKQIKKIAKKKRKPAKKRGRPRGSKNKFGPKGPLGRQTLTEGEIRQFNLGTLPIRRKKKAFIGRIGVPRLNKERNIEIGAPRRSLQEENEEKREFINDDDLDLSGVTKRRKVKKKRGRPRTLIGPRGPEGSFRPSGKLLTALKMSQKRKGRPKKIGPKGPKGHFKRPRLAKPRPKRQASAKQLAALARGRAILAAKRGKKFLKKKRSGTFLTEI